MQTVDEKPKHLLFELHECRWRTERKEASETQMGKETEREEDSKRRRQK